MSRGCVPVVTDIESGVPDVVVQGETGFRFPIGDAVAFGERIAQLSADAGLLERLSRAAHARIIEGGYTAEVMAERYARVIREVYAEMVDGRYARPKALHFVPQIGYVAAPPSMQATETRAHLDAGVDYWDLGRVSSGKDEYNA